MQDKDCLYWIWLAQKCGVASRDFARLIRRVESPFELYRMESEELEGMYEISPRLRDALGEKSLEKAYGILRYCKKEGIGMLPYGDSRYPARLRNLEDPPVLLYYLGELPDFNNRLFIGVVGTRKMSEYGLQSAYTISYELSSANVCVVSGMASGVDGVAACAALEAGGDTVAVLGCGIDVIYPKEHRTLFRAIQRNGVILTEYAPGEKPLGFHFPKRNRIISGLCQGVLVVEGDLQSGAMITAARAIAQGREVFALPGKINEINAEGPNDLIREGANVALCAEDIILHYDFLYHSVIDYRTWRRSRGVAVSEKVLNKYGVQYVPQSSEQRSENIEQKQERKTRTSVEESVAVEKTERVEKALEKNVSVETTDPILASLDELTQQVFSLLPLDHAVAADAFLNAGIGIADAVTALTMLEISGLVQSLPGGLYTRK